MHLTQNNNQGRWGSKNNAEAKDWHSNKLTAIRGQAPGKTGHGNFQLQEDARLEDGKSEWYL